MADYAAIITFPLASQTYEALSKIKNTEGALGVRSAAVVEREANGHFRVADGGDSRAWLGTSTGTLIGLFVGILGGPLGMLLGASVGALTGALVDTDHEDDAASVIEDYAARIPPGYNAIIAQTSEDDVTALNAFVSSMGGAIERRPLYDVLAEVEANAAAVKAARKAAREQVDQAKKANKDASQADVDARVAAANSSAT